VEGLHTGENPDDLVLGEKHQERLLVFGVRNGEEPPAPIQHRLEVELDAGAVEAQRRRLPPVLVSTE